MEGGFTRIVCKPIRSSFNPLSYSQPTILYLYSRSFSLTSVGSVGSDSSEFILSPSSKSTTKRAAITGGIASTVAATRSRNMTVSSSELKRQYHEWEWREGDIQAATTPRYTGPPSALQPISNHATLQIVRTYEDK
jgi:hypothetical protein